MPTAFNVWAPQGNVVTNPSGKKLGNPSVIAGLTGTILGGTVFGGWFGDDQAGTIYYYESADGLTSWTASPSNPITPASSLALFPTVYTDGTTFYLYGCTSSFPGTGIAVFTSTDRVTWTAHGVQIPLGGVGAWDHNGTFQLNIVDKVAGTWYAYYSGYNGSQFGQGLVTSTDLITWTKSVSNPIFPGPIGNMCFLKASGFYFAYAPSPSPNASLAAVNSNPITRWSSVSPSGPWTQLLSGTFPVPTYYVSTPTELNNPGNALPGVNANDPRMVVSGGNLYLYYTLTTTGGTEQSINAALAASTTPSQLVATFEGVFNVPFTGIPSLNLSTLASDNFTRADANPIGGNWTPRVAGSTSQILSNVVRSSTAGSAGDSYWNALAWNADQWSQITINNETTGSFVGASVRTSTGGVATSYRLILQTGTGSGANLVPAKQVAGTGTNLATLAFTINVGDTLMYVSIGTSILVYWNGYLVAAFTDSAIASGSAGFEIVGATAVTNSGLNAWSGGTFQSAPSPPPLTTGSTGSLMMLGCGT